MDKTTLELPIPIDTERLTLRPYQAEIDRVLDKSGNCQGRLSVLGTLIQGKLLEMQKELYKLNEILQRSVTSH